MNPQELRIGSLLTDKSGIIRYVSYISKEIIGFDGVCPIYCSLNDSISPILITEELLGRLGEFSRCEDYIYVYGYFNGYFIDNRNNDEIWYFEIGGSSHPARNEMVEIKYVHQIQNLYFALTGNELTLK